MKSFFKKFFKVTGITVLVIIILLIFIPIFFKDQIAEIVKNEINKNLNAKVEFTDYGLSLFSDFPDFSFQLEGLTVVGVDTFANDTLAKINSFNISIDLFSVFSGDYEINKIEIVEPELHLIALDSMNVNWNIAKPSEEVEVVETEEEKPDTAKFKLALKKFEIEDAEIIYDDRAGNTYIEVKGFDYILRGDFTQDLITLENELGIQSLSIKMGGIKYIKNAIVKINADIDANLKERIFIFSENEFQINDLSFGWDGKVDLLGDATDIALTFEAKKTDFKNFLSLIPGIYSKNFSDIQTKGQLRFSGYIKGMMYENNLPAFAINIFVENAMFRYPDLPKSVDNIFIDTKITNPGGSANNTVIDISKLHCEIAGNPIDVKLKVSTPVSDPQIDGYVNGKLDLAQVKEFYPLEKGSELNGLVNANLEFAGKLSTLERKEYDKFKSIGQVEITDMNYKSDEFKAGAKIEKLLLKFSPQFVELAEFKSQLGHSDIQAQGKIDNIFNYVFGGDVLSGKLKTNSNLMNLNEFMTDEEVPAEKPLEEEIPLVVIEVPGNLDFYLDSYFGKLIFDNMEMTDVNAVVLVKNHRASIQSVNMNTLEGQMSMTGFYDTKNPQSPIFNFNMNIVNFDFNQVFKTFTSIQPLIPLAEKTKGKFSATMKISSELDEQMKPKLGTLNAAGSLTTSQISISDFQPLLKLADALKNDKLKSISLNEVFLSFQIADGKAFIEPFDFSIGNIKAQFAGYSSLDQTINYVTNLDIPRTEFGESANNLLLGLESEAKNLGVNLKVSDIVKVNAIITGSITNPNVKIQLQDAVEGNPIDDLKKQAEDEINKQKEELEKKAQEEVDKLKQQAEDEIERLKKETEEKAKQEELRLQQEAEAKKKAIEDSIKKAAEEEAKKKLKKLF